MKTAVETALPHLESIHLEGEIDFEARLEALEKALHDYTRRLEVELLGRIRHIEDLLTSETLTLRTEMVRETACREEQIARLAGKVSRKIDVIHEKAVTIEKTQSIVDDGVEAKIEHCLGKTRSDLERQVDELRQLFAARDS